MPDMFNATVRAIERGKRTLGSSVDRGRRALQRAGYQINPVGPDASKLGVPGTYRPVGLSCPPACALLGICYADDGHVAIAARRSDITLERSLAASTIAIISAMWCDTWARLHVSGDFGQTPDELYIDGLVDIGSRAQSRYGRADVAWTYTHHTRGLFEPYRLLLAAAGVQVVYSLDMPATGKGCAFIVPMGELRSYAGQRLPDGARLVACPAQLTHNRVQCAQCGACPEAWQRGLSIVFGAHGRSSHVIERLV